MDSGDAENMRGRAKTPLLWCALALTCLALISAPRPTQAGDFKIEGSITGELRYFPDGPAYGDPDGPVFDHLQDAVRHIAPDFIFPFTGQEDRRLWPSVAIRLAMTYEADNGKDVFSLRPFARYDPNNNRRTHFDLREASWTHEEENWDLLVGASQVHWGVTESRQLVDIVNQLDFVEDIGFDREKLGQPMVNLNLFGDWGELSLFYLPYFREMTFPSNNARLRGPLPIDTDATTYESSLKQWHPDFAARYSNTWGDADLGLSFFHGTSREPKMKIELTPLGISAVPTYGIMTQVGVDALYAQENILWKLEAITRWGQGDPFFAAVAGFEYTVFDAFGSGADIGILGEYLYDGRDQEAPATVFDNDIFAGLRITMNDPQDTNILMGATVDLNNQHIFFNLDATRRIGENWQLQLDARLFLNTPAFEIWDLPQLLHSQPDPLEYVADDSYIQLKLARFF